ncbi:MAG: hypothetical protein NC131_17930 [Roseburia sp.]|nr:hypothetical protein [Roseburia sp.]
MADKLSGFERALNFMYGKGGDIESQLKIPLGFNRVSAERKELERIGRSNLNVLEKITRYNGPEKAIRIMRQEANVGTPVVRLRGMESTMLNVSEAVTAKVTSILGESNSVLTRMYAETTTDKCYKLEDTVNYNIIHKLDNMIKYYGIDIVYDDLVIHMPIVLSYLEEYRLITDAKRLSRTESHTTIDGSPIVIKCDRFKIGKVEEVWEYELIG